MLSIIRTDLFVCYDGSRVVRKELSVCAVLHSSAPCNTALPSSAAIERFFSKCGISFHALRNVLGDRTLEKEVMLNVNKKCWP